MGCLLAMFAGLFPRVAVFIMWLARPGLFEAAFGSALWPLLGIVFLPFTTLMYVILWSPTVGLTGWDFLWLIIAFFIDLSSAGASAYSNRDRYTGYVS
jgi:hypothetical protein